MGLKYYVLDRPDLSGGKYTGNRLYYGQVCVNERVSYDELCESVSLFTTATGADVACILDGLVLLMRRHLLRGYIVELGDLGNFRLSGGSQGVKQKGDFTAGLFKTPRILFAPGRILKELCTKVRFERAKVNVIERG